MPVQEEEYCVFPKSKYQSDGWEPFLPPHPLSDTVFEHLALEFQARKRALDQVRRNQTTGPEDEFFVCNNHDAKSRNSLAIDLSQIPSVDDFADRLISICPRLATSHHWNRSSDFCTLRRSDCPAPFLDGMHQGTTLRVSRTCP